MSSDRSRFGGCSLVSHQPVIRNAQSRGRSSVLSVVLLDLVEEVEDLADN